MKKVIAFSVIVLLLNTTLKAQNSFVNNGYLVLRLIPFNEMFTIKGLSEELTNIQILEMQDRLVYEQNYIASLLNLIHVQDTKPRMHTFTTTQIPQQKIIIIKQRSSYLTK